MTTVPFAHTRISLKKNWCQFRALFHSIHTATTPRYPSEASGEDLDITSQNSAWQNIIISPTPSDTHTSPYCNCKTSNLQNRQLSIVIDAVVGEMMVLSLQNDEACFASKVFIQQRFTKAPAESSEWLQNTPSVGDLVFAMCAQSIGVCMHRIVAHTTSLLAFFFKRGCECVGASAGFLPWL